MQVERLSRLARTTLLAAALLFAAVGFLPGHADAAEPLRGLGTCGDLQPKPGQYGPYDYRKHPEKAPLVERFHFTPKVESLVGGESSARIGGDIDYTLRAFPNHPRALYAMTRYGQLHNGASRVPGALFPIECYFDRALRFAPDDAQVHALYADYLIKKERKDDARKQLEAAERLELNPQIEYNLALAWSALGENEKALALAKRAYAGGVQFPALREQLVRAGVWK
ncbi:MAG: ABC transporter permease [Burkholderiaceae bacterium]|jgi:Flp pilus assembly protein TadD|nr:ABC transporter permease [Burkholderiaceae bacterium]